MWGGRVLWDPNYYEHLLHMLLNFFLKSSEYLPLVFFPGPIPSSPLNLGCHTCWSNLWRILCSRSCSHLQGEETCASLPWGGEEPSLKGDDRLTVERKVALLSRVQLASQMKLRCPTAPARSQHLQVLGASWPKPDSWSPVFWGADGTPQRVISLAPMNCTFSHQGFLGVMGWIVSPPPKVMLKS